MNWENFLITFSTSVSEENSLHSDFSLRIILVPLSNPTYSTSDISYSPVPSETHLTAGNPSFFENTSTRSETMKLE